MLLMSHKGRWVSKSGRYRILRKSCKVLSNAVERFAPVLPMPTFELGWGHPGGLPELVAQMLRATVTHLVCDFGEGQFVVQKQFFRPLDFLGDDEFFNRHALDRRKQAAQLPVFVQRFAGEELRKIHRRRSSARRVVDFADDQRFDLFHEAACTVVQKFKTFGFEARPECCQLFGRGRSIQLDFAELDAFCSQTSLASQPPDGAEAAGADHVFDEKPHLDLIINQKSLDFFRFYATMKPFQIYFLLIPMFNKAHFVNLL